ncbi:primosomal protein N' [Sphaerisporangium fuscum]|uniref:primosomal protein N' n=1 Tax=Sphaerisporangium fuscum TaxID=2835868 RepID=UPI0027E30210|nr:primosomal protein N' [Sphaerisporangium fuscum]
MDALPGNGKGVATPAKGAVVPAGSLPVARVLVDNPLPHLDRPFDYLVPEAMAAEAVPGCRVRVRFAGKLVDGVLLERAEETEHEGRLAPLERVVSAEPVLTPEVAALCRAVADRYAGTMSDVLRLAVPPRHARVEGEHLKGSASLSEDEGVQPAVGGVAETAAADGAEPGAGAGVAGVAGSSGDGAGADAGPASRGIWDEYPTGPSFLTALAEGRAPRAVWTVLPGAHAGGGAGVGGRGRRGAGVDGARGDRGAAFEGDGGPGWAEGIAVAVRAALAGGRGAVVVVPDGKDVALLDAASHRILGEGRHVALTADLGPAERYRRWLRVLRGQVRVVIGTRAAAFAPVRDLGLVVIWDDGDDLHAERLAPYPHAREVLGLRAQQTGAAMLIAGYGRTAEATRLVATGWARAIVAPREVLRRYVPRVRPAGDDADLARDEAARAARLPSVAWAALKHGLASGPVLVQVPRRGYLPALACQTCRAPARCVQSPPGAPDPGSLEHPLSSHGDPRRTARSAGYGDHLGHGVPEYGDSRGAGRYEGYGDQPGTGGRPGGFQAAAPVGGEGYLAVSGRPAGHAEGGPVAGGPLCGGPLALRNGHAAPYCRWCGRIAGTWRCQMCGGNRMRAVVVGARRTAEELGRAFPSVRVKTSGREGVLATVGSAPALVVATPGAEPVADGGYAAAVLLDGWALLGRADLRASEETLRRWMNAAALLRPAAELVVLADSSVPAVQALLRWDPVTHAERELAERATLGFPPAVHMATLTGPAAAVREMAADLRLPEGAQILGPVPLETPRPMAGEAEERLMVRVPRADGGALARALKGAAGVRSARKAPDMVRVCMDPIDLI